MKGGILTLALVALSVFAEEHTCQGDKCADADDAALLRLASELRPQKDEEEERVLLGEAGEEGLWANEDNPQAGTPGQLPDRWHYQQCYDSNAYTPSFCCPGYVWCDNKPADSTACMEGRPNCWGHGYTVQRCCPNNGASRVLKPQFFNVSSVDTINWGNRTVQGTGHDTSYWLSAQNSNTHQWLTYHFGDRHADKPIRLDRMDINNHRDPESDESATEYHQGVSNVNLEVPDCVNNAPYGTDGEGLLWNIDTGSWTIHSMFKCERPGEHENARCTQYKYETYWNTYIHQSTPQVAFRVKMIDNQPEFVNAAGSTIPRSAYISVSEVEFFGIESPLDPIPSSLWPKLDMPNMTALCFAATPGTMTSLTGQCPNPDSMTSAYTAIDFVADSSHACQGDTCHTGEKTLSASNLLFWQSDSIPTDQWLVFDFRIKKKLNKVIIRVNSQGPTYSTMYAPETMRIEVPHPTVCGGWKRMVEYSGDSKIPQLGLQNQAHETLDGDGNAQVAFRDFTLRIPGCHTDAWVMASKSSQGGSVTAAVSTHDNRLNTDGTISEGHSDHCTRGPASYVESRFFRFFFMNNKGSTIQPGLNSEKIMMTYMRFFVKS